MEKSRRKVSGWFSAEKAHISQLHLSKRVIQQDTLPERIRHVAGVDVAFTKEKSIAAVTVLNYNSLSLVESKTAHVKTMFPYIPTLLSFREVPPTVAAIRRVELQPDVFLVDGQGTMHPYRLGLASHLGLILDKPTIGVAKSPLTGKIGEFNEERWAPVTDGDEVLGAALMTKESSRPLYVSVGHKVSLNRSIEIVKHCTRRYRAPEPIRLAHNIATDEKQKIQNVETS